MTGVETPKFWLVWRVGTPTTQYRHYSHKDAYKEAERLSKIEPDEVVFVLQVVEALFTPSMGTRKIHIKECGDDQIPF